MKGRFDYDSFSINEVLDFVKIKKKKKSKKKNKEKESVKII